MNSKIYYGPRPEREIRAVYDEDTIRVYQAFGTDIAWPALANQTFVAPFRFKVSWASWVKPSFLWCMARTDWGRYCRIGSKGKPENENCTVVLCIDLSRVFFNKVIQLAVDTHLFETIKKEHRQDVKMKTKAYVQWDPEKDLSGNRRLWRAIQIGIRTPLLREYASEIVHISDMSETINKIKQVSGDEEKISLLPPERPYPLPKDSEINWMCTR